MKTKTTATRIGQLEKEWEALENKAKLGIESHEKHYAKQERIINKLDKLYSLRAKERKVELRKVKKK